MGHVSTLLEILAKRNAGREDLAPRSVVSTLLEILADALKYAATDPRTILFQPFLRF